MERREEVALGRAQRRASNLFSDLFLILISSMRCEMRMGGRQKGSAVHGGGLFSIKREEEKGLEGLLYLHQHELRLPF